MLQIGVLFFTALITFTAAAPPQINLDSMIVYMDLTGCVNLKCEIQGFIITPPRKPYTRVLVGALKENESEAQFLKRQQLEYPFNTFTIMKYPDSYEVGRSYALLCNAGTFINYKQFIDYLKDPEAPFKPKFVCGDEDKPIFHGMMHK